MENASKALIIAASTLIALMILASMFYIFREGSRIGENYDRSQLQRNLELYNSRFLKYNKDDNNIMDMISLCNLAYDINVSSEYSPSMSVEILINLGGSAGTYRIPNEDPHRADYIRNMILDNSNNPVSIYNLANRKIGGGADGLGISSDAAVAEKRLAETFLRNNRQEYYYLFECVGDVGTNPEGRINHMEFRIRRNT